MKKSWKRCLFISPASPANLFIAMHLFLFLPVLLFITSRYFWNYGFDAFFVVLFPLFILCYGALSIPTLFIKREWLHHYASVLTGIAFAGWASDWFVGSNGVIDGKTFILITEPIHFYGNLLLIVLIGISFGSISYYKPKFTNTILLLASFAFAMIVLGYALIEHKVSFLNYQQSQQELTTFSKKKNVLLILLDSFQSDFFQEILNKKPSWAKELDGFTFYSNAASTAPGTMLSLPTIHSSQVYQQGEDLSAFYKKNIAKESFVKLLQTQNYRAMILNPYFGYTPSGVARVNQNYLSCTHFGALCEASQLISYSLFNSVPHLFKKYVYNQGFWLLPQYFPPAETVSNQVLSVLASHLNTESTVPTVKFLHLYSAHAPAMLDQSCHLLRGLTWTRESAVNQAQCAMEHVIKVLQTLKKQHIYQQTAILIIADHGSGLPLDHSSNTLPSSGNPLLLFKSFHQTTQLKNSSELVSLIDIKDMICEATHDCGTSRGQAIPLALTLKKRHRLPFNYYKVDQEINLIRVYPFEIIGSPRDPNSWVKVPPSKDYIHSLPFMGSSFEDYAGYGWGATGREPSWLRWAVGKQAEIYLPLPPHQKATISLTATTHRMNQGQVLSVWINKRYIGQFPIPVNRYRRISFDVPKNVITKKPAQVLFQFSKSNRLPGQANEYPLAVGFYGFLYVS